MSYLMPDESTAITKWVTSAFNDQPAFEAFLGRATVGKLSDFSSPLSSMLVVAYEFNVWIEADPTRIVSVGQLAAAEYPHHESLPAMQKAIQRISQLLARQAAAGSPWEVPHVEGRPVINRSKLRTALQAHVAGGTAPPVFLVDGTTGSGRTHSYFLIANVGSAFNIPVRRLRLDSYAVEDQTLKTVFDWLVQQFELTIEQPSTEVGATPETVASRFADDLARALQQKPGMTQSWIVFDSIDRPLPKDLKAFLCAIANLRIKDELGKLVLFYLGAGQTYGITDNWSIAEFETLAPFSDHEIEATATAINSMGLKALAAAKLHERIAEIQKLMGPKDPGSFCNVSREMALLRREVEA